MIKKTEFNIPPCDFEPRPVKWLSLQKVGFANIQSKEILRKTIPQEDGFFNLDPTNTTWEWCSLIHTCIKCPGEMHKKREKRTL